MTGYHPFLAVLRRKRTPELMQLLLQVRGAGTGQALDEPTVARMSRDQLMAALLEWADGTGLARGQGDFGFITWTRGISESIRGRYDREAS